MRGGRSIWEGKSSRRKEDFRWNGGKGCSVRRDTVGRSGGGSSKELRDDQRAISSF